MAALTVDKVLTWSPGVVSSIASQLQSMASQTTGLVLQFTTVTNLNNAWTGAAGQQAEAVAHLLAGDIHKIVAELEGCSEALHGTAGQLQSLQTELRNVKTSVEALGPGWSLQPDGSVQKPAEPTETVALAPGMPDPLAVIWQQNSSQADSLATKAKSILSQISTIDASMARQLENASKSASSASTTWITAQSARLRGLASPAVLKAYDDLDSILNNSCLTPEQRQAALDAFYVGLSGLSPQDRINFINGLPPDTAVLWTNTINDEYGLNQYQLGSAKPPSEALRGLMSSVASMDQGTLLSNYNALPWLMPSTATPAEGGYYYTFSDDPIFHPDGSINLQTDVNQGQLGDCWFLAGLIAYGTQHPEVIQNNIKDNKDGTVTVTFYVNGKAVPETVSKTTVTSDGGYGFASSGNSGVNWAPMYEKAYAQLKGNYGQMWGNDPAVALAAIGGAKTDQAFVDDLPFPKSMDSNFNNIADDFKAKKPIVLSSNPATDDQHFIDSANKIAGSHAYAVVGVDEKAKTITVQNPWGAGASAPQFVTLKWDDVKKDFPELNRTK